MGGLFLVSAYLQLNDPDSLIWIVVYFIAAVASFLHSRLARSLLIGGVLACLVMTGVLLATIDGIDWRGVFASFNMEGQGVEEIREVGGLLIIAVWFTILAYVKERR